jgi:hypothetical protein
MKKLLLLLLTCFAFSSANAQTTSFPPRVGETWRVDVEGLAPATLKFTSPSSANPGAVDGTSQMAGFAGKARAASNQGQYLILWQGQEGVYYCVFADSPSIQGNTVKGLGAALQRPNSEVQDLNKGCSATQISSLTTSTIPSSVQPQAPMVVPAAENLPQKLEPGQSWRVSVIPNNDIYTLKLTKTASSVPMQFGSGNAGWFEASVDKVLKVSAFSLSPSELKGFAKLEAGVLRLYLLDDSLNVMGCDFANAKAQFNRLPGTLLPSTSGLSCLVQPAGNNKSIPSDAAAVLENAKRASGSNVAWAGLKTVAYRSQESDGLKQTVTFLDFVGQRLYKEYLQGSGSQQIVTAKEWQIPATGSKLKGTYKLESESSGVQYVNDQTSALDQELFSDFWALRFGGAGWDNATLETQKDGTQIVIAKRNGLYSRFVFKNGKYAGAIAQFGLQIIQFMPEKLADAGGLLAPFGLFNYTDLFSSQTGKGNTLLKVVVNFAIPADLFNF